MRRGDAVAERGWGMAASRRRSLRRMRRQMARNGAYGRRGARARTGGSARS